MNHLFRDLAPITDDTWSALDDEARTRLAPALGARALVDFAGPLGWTHSSTNVGRVTRVVDAPLPDVIARSRIVLPLTEVRAQFSLAREELDATARGAVDTDLAPLDQAASRLATVENAAVFHGWDAVGIAGIVPSSPHEPLTRADDPARLAQSVAAAVATLDHAGIGGPYGLALDTPGWASVMGGSDAGGSPLERHLRTILGGTIAWVPGIDGTVVLSQRGGDFLFESGQDISLGYASHTADAVTLYLEESFSFRVATPEAAIAIR
jgi:uncharacterized linocin/CFP29 family protein